MAAVFDLIRFNYPALIGGLESFPRNMAVRVIDSAKEERIAFIGAGKQKALFTAIDGEVLGADDVIGWTQLPSRAGDLPFWRRVEPVKGQ